MVKIRSSESLNLVLREWGKGGVFPYVVILFTALLVWWVPNFLGGGFIYVGDTPFPLTDIAIDRNIDSLYYIWSTTSGTGQLNLYGGSISYYLFIFILDALGLPLWVINRIIFVLPTAIWGWATYYLAKTLIKGEYSRVASTIAAVFIVLSPGYVPAFQNPQLGFGLAGIPLLLAALLRGIRSSNELNETIFYAFLASLATLLVAQSSPILIVLSFGTILLYMPLHIILTRSRLHKPELRFLLITLAIVVLMNFYWFLPFVMLFQQYDVLAIAHGLPGVITDIRSIYSLSPDASLLHVSRLILDQPNGLGYYFRESPTIVILSLALPAYVYLSLVVRRSGETLALAGTAIIITLFSTGTHYEWFAGVYEWLWNNLFLFRVLNSNFHYLSVLSIFYAVLIGITTQTLMSKVELRKLLPNINFPVKRLPVLRNLALVVVMAIIIANGGMSLALLGPSNTVNYARIKNPMVIPSSYDDLLSYLKDSNSHGFRLLVLPFQGYLTYKWFPGPDLSAGGVSINYSPLPVVGVGGGPPADPRFMEAVKSLDEGDVVYASKLLATLSVKYVLVSKDLSTNGFPGESTKGPEELARYFKILNRYPDLFVPILNTPEYSLYELSRSPVPMIFTSESSGLLVDMPDFDGRSAYIVVNASSSLTFTDSGSIFAWIYPEAAVQKTGSVDRAIAGFGSSGAWKLFISGNDHVLSASSFNRRVVYSNYSFMGNRWYFVGLVFSKSEITLYVDGKIVSREALFSASSPKELPLYIGHDGVASFFNGSITNVQIYRTALDEDQVLSLYHRGLDGSVILEADMVGWWPLKGVQRRTPDFSTHNNTGVMEGNMDVEKFLIIPSDGLESPYVTPTSDSRVQSEYVMRTIFTRPFVVFLNADYDRNWLVHANGKPLSLIRSVDGYASAWYSDNVGDVTIKLEYQPQSVVLPAFIASTLTALMVVLLMLGLNTALQESYLVVVRKYKQTGPRKDKSLTRQSRISGQEVRRPDGGIAEDADR